MTVPAQPRDEIVDEIAAIYADVLSLSSVDPGEHLFRLGGSSEHAVAILHRVTSAYGEVITLEDVLTCGTVVGLAGIVRARFGTPGAVTEGA